jgi:hypothetical protein
MQYTINGFSQEKLVSLKLDADDALILRWFVDFYHTGKMAKVYNDGKEYLWVKYSAIIDDLPILGINTPKNIGRHFRNFIECGLMEQFVKRDIGGSFSCFRLVEEVYTPLVQGGAGMSHVTTPGCPVTKDNSGGAKDSSINNPSINNPNIRAVQASPSPLSPDSSNNSTLFPESGNEQEGIKDTVPPAQRHKYGSENNVLLTDSQYDALIKDYGEEKIKAMIEELSQGKALKGYKYKRDDIAIRKWIDRDKGKQPAPTRNAMQSASKYHIPLA